MQTANQDKKYEKYSQIPGDKFGRLTLTGKTFMKPDNSGKPRRMVEAKCECGAIRDYLFHLLKEGQTSSCGCLRKELRRESMSTHHLSKHPLYIIYIEMKQRCYNENNKGYHNYGGRGIKVCDEWLLDFQPFYDWCTTHGWIKGLDLDRENNDGNYEPDNCRFITRPESMRNTRSNRFYEAFGVSKCLTDWAKDERCQLNFWGLRSRLDRGWEGSFESALTTPKKDRVDIQRNNKNAILIEAFGKKMCMTAWLEQPECLIRLDTLRERLSKGWSAELAISTPPTRDSKNKK